MDDIVAERAYPTPFANSPLLPLLLMSLSVQKHTPDTSTRISTEYDYIIVGGGTAGSVMAGRLSEVPCVSVLLLEAGKPPPRSTEVPGVARSFIGSDIDWQYLTEPQMHTGAGLVNRQVVFPSGKALGGSGVFNAMQTVRGHRKYYDDWAAQGADGWSYDDVLPYFLKLEDTRDPEYVEAGFHGVGGPQTIERPRYAGEIKDPLFQAANLIGYEVMDPNGPTQTGFYDQQGLLRKGQRCSAAKAYLVPAENRTNLDIVPNAMVRKVLISNRRAVGVQFDNQGVTHMVKARREVIISAGTTNSAQLLMLSGVGPKQQLEKFGIPVIADLPVGQNLQDHCGTIVAFELSDKITPMEMKLGNDGNINRYINNRTGPLASTEGIAALAFLQNEVIVPTEDSPDHELSLLEGSTSIARDQIGMIPEVYQQVFKPYENRALLFCIAQILHPKSRGYVLLRSSNPYDPPIINPNYFEDPADLEDVVQAMKACQRIGSSPPMQGIGTKPLATLYPGCENVADDDDRYFRCQARSVVLTMSHPVGTAKMGNPNDPFTVVDQQLRVKTIKGLRVVDASIMPILPSAHTYLPTLMVAEKAADIIRSSITCHRPTNYPDGPNDLDSQKSADWKQKNTTDWSQYNDFNENQHNLTDRNNQNFSYGSQNEPNDLDRHDSGNIEHQQVDESQRHALDLNQEDFTNRDRQDFTNMNEQDFTNMKQNDFIKRNQLEPIVWELRDSANWELHDPTDWKLNHPLNWNEYDSIDLNKQDPMKLSQYDTTSVNEHRQNNWDDEGPTNWKQQLGSIVNEQGSPNWKQQQRAIAFDDQGPTNWNTQQTGVAINDQGYINGNQQLGVINANNQGPYNWLNQQRATAGNGNQLGTNSGNSYEHGTFSDNNNQPGYIYVNQASPNALQGCNTVNKNQQNQNKGNGNQNIPIIQNAIRQCKTNLNGKQQVPSHLNGNRQFPIKVNGNRQSPTILNGNRQTPTILNGNRQIPVRINGNQHVPVVQNCNRQIPIRLHGNQQAAVTQNCNQQVPHGVNGNRQFATKSNNNRQVPIKLNGNQQFPVRVYGNQSPVILNGNRQVPVIQNGNRQHPVILNGNRQVPVILNGNRQHSVIQSGNRQRPVILNGNRQHSVIQSGNRQRPVILNGNRQVHTNGNGNRQVPIILNGNRQNPILHKGNQQNPSYTNGCQGANNINNQGDSKICLQNLCNSLLNSMQCNTNGVCSNSNQPSMVLVKMYCSRR